MLGAYFPAAESMMYQDRGAHFAESLRSAIREVAGRFFELDCKRVSRELAERRYQIIIRCDLEREPTQHVAADLGMSPRQFRRERKATRERIARVLFDKRARGFTSPKPDETAIDRALAVRLWDTGMCEAALDLLRRVRRESSEIQHRINAHRMMAEILASRSMLDEGSLELRSAKALLAAESNMDEQTRILCECLMELGQSSLDKARNDPTLMQRLDRIVGRSLDLGAPTATALGGELLANALMQRIFLLVDRGALTQAREDAARLETFLAAARVSLPSIAIDLLTLQGDAARVQGDWRQAEAMLQRALALCHEHGFRRRLVTAQLLQSFVQFQYGDRDRAVVVARACVADAQRIGSPSLTVDAGAAMAQIETLEGHFRTAWRYLNLAKVHAPVGSLSWIQVTCASADLHVMAGDPLKALAEATEADRAAVALGNARFAGATLRMIAEANFSMGKRRRARRGIQAALEILDRSGSQLSLALAYNASATIASNARHRAHALDLFPNLARMSSKPKYAEASM
jgi:tetratricopeptide (TPR) repeat protein